MPHRSSYGSRLGSVWIRRKKRSSTSLTAASSSCPDTCAGTDDCDDPGNGKRSTSIIGVADETTTMPHGRSGSLAVVSGGSSGSEAEDEVEVDAKTKTGDLGRNQHSLSLFPVALNSRYETRTDSARMDQSEARRRRHLVGWDEVRCRPIYKLIDAPGPSSGDGSDAAATATATATATASEDIRNTTKRIDNSTCTSIKRSDSALFCAEDGLDLKPIKEIPPTADLKRVYKKKSYGSSIISQPNFCLSSKRRPSNAIESTVSTWHASILSPNPHHTNSTSGSTVCNILDSDGLNIDIPFVTKDQNAKNLVPEMNWKVSEDGKQLPTVLPRRRKSNAAKAECRSLVQACSFFEQLDATQELTVDQSISPEIRRNRRKSGAKCIRTSRSVAQDEYKCYVDSTDITPLKIEDYMKHRKSFLISTGGLDGVLDS